MNILDLTAERISEAVKLKELAVKEVLDAFFEKIEQREKDLNCYITMDRESVYEQAERLQKKILAGEPIGALAGVPVAVKDNLCLQGMRTTAGSKMLENFMPPYTAEAVFKLQEADALILGKTNMDEFAMGNTTETSYFGSTKNPWNEVHVPGGSSGGSAAAVAAKEACMALGTDTGGSVRQPASYCGVVGIKPTYGCVSRYGLIAYASSMDQIGSLAGNVTDAARLLEVISGYDKKDATCIKRAEYDFTCGLGEDISGMRIGIPSDYMKDNLQPEVKRKIEHAAAMLENLGAAVEEFEIGLLRFAPPAYYVIAGAEASSNLARYDGVKYGFRASEYENLSGMHENSRMEGLGEEVRRRIRMGEFALSHGFYEDYYLQALKLRRMMKQSFEQAFQKYDVILGPVAPTTAPKLGAIGKKVVESYWNDIYTVAANLAGLPAMSLPFGADQQGLPIGIQLIADCFEERKMLQIAYALEQAMKGAEDHE